MKTIIRAKGGTRERKVRVETIKIPDLWEVLKRIHPFDLRPADRKAILETWHLAHDLLRAVREQ